MWKKYTMKTKKTKNKPRRTIRRKHNRKSIKRKSMKGGTILPYSDLSQAFNLIGNHYPLINSYRYFVKLKR